MNFKYCLEEFMKIKVLEDKSKKEIKLCKQYYPSLEKLLILCYKQEQIILDPVKDKELLKIISKLEKKYLKI